jgi:predicted ATPase
VPLFVEELTKAVLESGANVPAAVSAVPHPALSVPANLHASLMARLDRLGPAAKDVAQAGAAIGREFGFALLASSIDLPEPQLREALDRLTNAGLLFIRGTPPQSSYVFKHALVQDVAYGTLLRGRRQRLHAHIAATLEDRFPEIVAAQPALLAQHCANAGRAEQAVAYWRKAGQQALARSAMAEAAAQFQKGLAQLELLPENRERQRHELEIRSDLCAVLQAIKGYAARETGDAYARARKLWEQLDAPSEFLEVLYGQSHYHSVRGEIDLALCLDEGLVRLSRQRNDAVGVFLGNLSLGRASLPAGRLGPSRLYVEEALALYEPISHLSRLQQDIVHPQVASKAYLGNALFCLGFPDEALARSNAAIAEARRLAHLPSLAASLVYGARLHSLVGDNAGLDERADELVALTTERGFPHWGAQGTIYRGWVKVKTGDLAEGISLLRSGSTTYRATGAEAWMTYHNALLAAACEIAGQIEEALTLLDDALRLAERTGERWFVSELNRHKGELLLRQGHTEAAEKLYRKALSVAAKQGAKQWELRAAASLARLRRNQERRAEARDLLVPIYDWFTEGFDTPDLKEAKALLDELT